MYVIGCVLGELHYKWNPAEMHLDLSLICVFCLFDLLFIILQEIERIAKTSPALFSTKYWISD